MDQKANRASPLRTPAPLLPLAFEDTQKRNPTAAMELLGGLASRAVKYHGFAPPPSKKITSKAWGEKKTWNCMLQPVCTYLPTSTGALSCITDSAKIFHCLILPYISVYKSEISSWNIFRCRRVVTPPNLKFQCLTPHHHPPLRGDICTIPCVFFFFVCVVFFLLFFGGEGAVVFNTYLWINC